MSVSGWNGQESLEGAGPDPNLGRPCPTSRLITSRAWLLNPADRKRHIHVPLDVPPGPPARPEARLHLVVDISPRHAEPSTGMEQVRQALRDFAARCSQPPLPEGRAAEVAGEGEAMMVERFLPLRNLVNFRLFAPDGSFCGRGETRFLGRVVTVGGRACSPGFLQGRRVIPGAWQVVLETHAIVSPRLDVHLAAWVCEGCECSKGSLAAGSGGSSAPGSATASHPAGAGPSAPVAVPRAWLRGDCHVHTSHSDGALDAEALVAHHRRLGYEFIVVTDHNNVAGLQDLGLLPHGGNGGKSGNSGDGRAGDVPAIVIPGMEFTTFHGHALAVGLTDYVDWECMGKDSTLEDVAGHVHRQGALFCVAHPCTVGDPVSTGSAWDFPRFAWGGADLLEVWCGAWDERRLENLATLALWDRLLNSGYHIVGVGGSDLHDPARDGASASRPVTCVRVAGRGWRDLVDALGRGGAGVYVTRGIEGPELEVALDGEAVASGRERVAAGSRPSPSGFPAVSAEVSGLTGPASLVLIVNGVVAAATPVGPAPHGARRLVRFDPFACADRAFRPPDRTSPRAAWCRLELRSVPTSAEPWTMLALSNPLYLQRSGPGTAPADRSSQDP